MVYIFDLSENNIKTWGEALDEQNNFLEILELAIPNLNLMVQELIQLEYKKINIINPMKMYVIEAIIDGQKFYFGTGYEKFWNWYDLSKAQLFFTKKNAENTAELLPIDKEKIIINIIEVIKIVRINN